MASNRHNAARHPPAEAVVPLEEETTHHHVKPQPQDAKPPRAGRTGGLGSRAERPNETRRKGDDKLHSTGRGAKAPSARKSAHSDDRSSK